MNNIQLKTPIAYYGGKQMMLKYILPLIPEHEQYVEPFIGGGAVFWAKTPSKYETINDKDNRIINFYLVMKNKFDELYKLVDQTLQSEYQYNLSKQILKGEVEATDVEKAWALWVNVNLSFNKILLGGSSYGRKESKICFLFKKQNFINLANRLEKVEIFCRDALDVIQIKNAENTFMYIDPPYFNANMGHYKGYSEEDFKNLLELLSKAKFKFLLSCYPSELIQEYINQNKWNIISKELFLSASPKKNCKRKKKTELLVYNYNLPNNFNLN